MAVAVGHYIFADWGVRKLLYLFREFSEGLLCFLEIGQLERKIGWLFGVLEGLGLHAV